MPDEQNGRDHRSAHTKKSSASPWPDEVGLTEVTLSFSNHSSRLVAGMDAGFSVRFGWQSLQMPLANISSYAVVHISMDCQICLRQLEALEPVYRMRLGPAINGGSRTLVCQKCLHAFLKTSKSWTLRDRFGPSEPCAACGRPVFDLKGWKPANVFCSPVCRSLTDNRTQKGHCEPRSRSETARSL